MSCRHSITDDAERIVIRTGEHADPPPDDHDLDCRGCVRCHERHCSICCCHLDAGELATCHECVGKTRRDLIACIDLVALLPEHAVSGGQHGHLVAADPIPGGDATVMLAHGSEGVSDDGESSPVEHMPPSYLLTWWEENWRAELGHPYPADRYYPAISRIISQAYDYLNTHLGWAAANHRGFRVFAADIAACRRHLEGIARAGDWPDEGVPCFRCNTTLVRDYRDPRPCGCSTRIRVHAPHRDDLGCLACRWETSHERCDQGGLKDPTFDKGWYCPRCQRVYSAGEYQLAVKAVYDEHAEYRRLADVIELTGVTRGTIQTWASRGHVRRRRDTSGRVVYNLPDIKARHAQEP